MCVVIQAMWQIHRAPMSVELFWLRYLCEKTDYFQSVAYVMFEIYGGF